MCIIHLQVKMSDSFSLKILESVGDASGVKENKISPSCYLFVVRV